MTPREFQELSAADGLRLLAGVPMGRIVFTHRALPAIRPVNHLVVDGQIIIRTNSGTVLSTEVAPAGSVVAFEAGELDAEQHLGWSVIVTGIARPVDDPQEAEGFKARLRPWVSGEMDQVIRINPEIVTAFRLVPAAPADRATPV